ncbi:MAG: polysulfide reductase NrfD [Chloroflexi bacterium]|nr:polysulfide reductase NrfD [Chloroflexota bacterium]
MEERRILSDTEINLDLLAPVYGTPRWFWPVVGLLGLVVAAAVGAFIWMLTQGLVVTGLNRPVFWGFMITNFVFWVGISHAGVMISSILRLAQAEWRRPVTRAAELLTILALLTAALFPIIHSGRPWRTLYWVFPYDFARGIWPNVRSPLVWDPAAIFSYLTGATLFIYVALLPDLATLRDRSLGWRHYFYGALSLGWRGMSRQWRLQALVGILLSALILPVFISVHSVVSWDFAVATAVEGWHATIFAPYFVLGAIHSGVSAVVTVMALVRYLYGWKAYIRPEHFDALGRLLVAVGLAWFYFFALEFAFGLYGQDGPEVALREMVVFQMPWAGLFIVFLLTAFFIPVPLWLFRRVRRNIPLMLLLSVLVNIGMWLERFLIIVPGLARKEPFTFVWGSYAPSIVEILLIAGSFALVCLGFLVFSRLFPLIPLYDQKEGQVLRQEVEVGRARVKAVIREE